MLVIQQFILHWGKDCRGGQAAIRRRQFPQGLPLPENYFDYLAFGAPIHRAHIVQNPAGFRQRFSRREISEFDAQNSLRLSPFEIIPNADETVEVRYRYDWDSWARPGRYQYSAWPERKPLNERAFLLKDGDYGRAMTNGRFVDYDTGNWWYELNIVNVLVTKQKKVPLDCLVTAAPTAFYQQLAWLY